MFNIYNLEPHWRLFTIMTPTCIFLGIFLSSGMTFKLHETKEAQRQWWRFIWQSAIVYTVFFVPFCAFMFLSGKVMK